MENRLKLHFSRIIRSSFGSCKTQILSDVVDHKSPFFNPPSDRFQSSPTESFVAPNPKSRRPPATYPSMCRPRCPESFEEMVRDNCILPKESFPRHKISERNSLYDADDFTGHRCPPVSPASPLNQYFKLQTDDREKRKTKKKKPRKKKSSKPKKSHLKSSRGEAFPCPFISSSNDEDWFSSDDEREDENLFSSKSVSFSSYWSVSLNSDSEPSRPPIRLRNRRKMASKDNPEMGLLPLQGKMKGCFAVAKSSSDPHRDFRTSMVEMIIERQLFGAQELEQLLQCFLSLNSAHHHSVIVEVFTEIWETLFSSN
ncbi:hypothetical protein Nepgr_005135 [Nepenthes gracilis]|uniref:Transcription repressor n=1 Tax=Nepenthes gracilis TaxID=150966 RepID=A0AAD3S2S1_NEPGR|nr:hypothetical protein Nepgr_005135 [Nepenthes gracilis]